MKMCIKCNTNKPYEDFNKNSAVKDGRSSYCKVCQKEYAKNYHKKNYKRKYTADKIIGDTRICTLCNTYKPFDAFRKSNQSWCIECNVEYDRKRNEKGLVKPRKYLEGKMHCRECGEYFEKDSFTIRKHTNTRCDSCQILHQHNKTVKKHGITYDQYLEIFESQGGVCAICGGEEKSYRTRLCIDHDHACCPGDNSCGQCIRGLLCSSCNMALGNAKDSVDILQKMIEYLQK